MSKKLTIFGFAAALTVLSGCLAVATAANDSHHDRDNGVRNVQVGPRPYFLVDDMDPSPLKTALKQCSEKPFHKTDFSIGHRGAALQFPEHTRESHAAGARMGAGIVECDVTFTKDKEFVCRHAQNDLHTTTNILATPLAKKCITPIHSRASGPDGSEINTGVGRMPYQRTHPGGIQDPSGKMDGFNSKHNGDEFMDGTPNFRTNLYTSLGTLMTHARKHPAVQRSRREDDPGIEIPHRDHAFRRVHPGAIRAEDDRRIQRRPLSPRDVWPHRSINPIFSTGSITNRLRQAGGLPRRC